MRNERLAAAWDEVTPDATTQERLLQRIEAANANAAPARRPARWRVWALAAAGAVVLVAAAVVPRVFGPHGVTVNRVDPPETLGVALALTEMTEDELLADNDIFAGEIVRVDGIRVEFSDWNDTMSVLTVRVDQAVRGALTPGDEVTVLVHPAIGLDCSICQLTAGGGVGTTGLFVARPTDENAWAKSLDGSEVFHYSDVARYWLPDPVRYLFLDTPEGVAFSRFGWPSLAAQSAPVDADISLAPSLGAVEAFLRAAIA
ncbi:MAG: hypothetical protein LBK42_09685 [Propionibacteriaceae bacterium]|jgi:hypothetical protein|nr:hypothetical protein [Propionibacteriaceae bacterium]